MWGIDFSHLWQYHLCYLGKAARSGMLKFIIWFFPPIYRWTGCSSRAERASYSNSVGLSPPPPFFSVFPGSASCPAGRSSPYVGESWGQTFLQWLSADDCEAEWGHSHRCLLTLEKKGAQYNLVTHGWNSCPVVPLPPFLSAFPG